jgi:two-component sensor histidine kinase
LLNGHALECRLRSAAGNRLVKCIPQMDFEALFNSLPTPSMVMDTDFDIVAVNEAYLDVTMRLRESLIGANVFKAFPAEGESRRLLQDSFERVRDKGIVDVLPVLPYAIAGQEGLEARSWNCTHVPIRDQDGQVVFVLQNTQDISQLQQSLQPANSRKGKATLSESSRFRSLEMVQMLNETLLATAHHLQRLFMNATNFMCVLQGPDHVLEMGNLAFIELAGGRDLVGQMVRQSLPEFIGQEYHDILDNVFRSSQTFVGRKMRALLQNREGAVAEHFLDIVCQPILSANGEVNGVFVEGSDVTDHVRAEQAQSLLIRELHHRVRNTLATVQGVMTTTAKSSETIEEFREAFAGRIASLAMTHSAMTEKLEQSVSFRQLLNQELGPYFDDQGLRIQLTGPAVDLPSQVGVPLGMAVHELAVNAVRYGALSRAEGHLKVTWSLIDSALGPRLLCEWREEGGPTVTPPVREGFGSMLLKRVLSQQIGAEVKIAFDPEGFRLNMIIPIQVGC